MAYDTTDEADVSPKMDFRLEFNQEDPELWFATLERNMLTRGIKSQLSKEAVLVANLPRSKQSAEPTSQTQAATRPTRF